MPIECGDICRLTTDPARLKRVGLGKSYASEPVVVVGRQERDLASHGRVVYAFLARIRPIRYVYVRTGDISPIPLSDQTLPAVTRAHCDFTLEASSHFTLAEDQKVAGWHCRCDLHCGWACLYIYATHSMVWINAHWGATV